MLVGLFSRFGNRTKRGVEVRHPTRCRKFVENCNNLETSMTANKQQTFDYVDWRQKIRSSSCNLSANCTMTQLLLILKLQFLEKNLTFNITGKKFAVFCFAHKQLRPLLLNVGKTKES